MNDSLYAWDVYKQRHEHLMKALNDLVHQVRTFDQKTTSMFQTVGLRLDGIIHREDMTMARLDDVTAVLDKVQAKVQETAITLQELVDLAKNAVTPEEIAAVTEKAQGILDNLTAAEDAADPTPDVPPVAFRRV